MTDVIQFIEKLEPKPGDVIVVTMRDMETPERYESLQRLAAKLGPEITVIARRADTDIEVLPQNFWINQAYAKLGYMRDSMLPAEVEAVQNFLGRCNGSGT